MDSNWTLVQTFRSQHTHPGVSALCDPVPMARRHLADPRKTHSIGKAKAKVKQTATTKKAEKAVSTRARKTFSQNVTKGSDAASSVLSETLSEALDDIVETLVLHPGRILLIQKFARNEKLFLGGKASSKQAYLHHTIIHMHATPKKLWKEIMVQYSSIAKGASCLDACLNPLSLLQCQRSHVRPSVCYLKRWGSACR